MLSYKAKISFIFDLQLLFQLIFIFYGLFFIFYILEFCLLVCVHDGVGSHGTKVTGSCDLTCAYRDLNLGLLQNNQCS